MNALSVAFVTVLVLSAVSVGEWRYSIPEWIRDRLEDWRR